MAFLDSSNKVKYTFSDKDSDSLMAQPFVVVTQGEGNGLHDNEMSIVIVKKKTGLRRKKRISPSGSLLLDYIDTPLHSDI